MPVPWPQGLGPTPTVDALIDHILTRYHETHRREMPVIVQLARGMDLSGVAPRLADDLAALTKALDLHMFKEEMRLFPMMEQGGNTLISRLIDDMQSEHLRHAETVAALEQQVATLRGMLSADPKLQALVGALGKLTSDLRQHMQLEDEVLFPMFSG